MVQLLQSKAKQGPRHGDNLLINFCNFYTITVRINIFLNQTLTYYNKILQNCKYGINSSFGFRLGIFQSVFETKDYNYCASTAIISQCYTFHRRQKLKIRNIMWMNPRNSDTKLRLKQMYLWKFLSNNFLNNEKQNQPSRGVLEKRCSENMKQINRRTPMPKCNFNKVY